MNYKPYRLIGVRLKDKLFQTFDSMLSNWSLEWLPDNSHIKLLSLEPLSEYHKTHGQVESLKMINWLDDNWCCLTTNSKLYEFGTILTELPQEDTPNSISSEIFSDVALQSLVELGQRFLSGNSKSYENVPFFTTDNNFPQDADRFASGAVIIRFQIDELKFSYVISPATVERYIKEEILEVQSKCSVNLTSLQEATKKQSVKASVYIGTAEIKLEELATISVGDVVTLDKKYNEHAQIKFDTNGYSCNGFIGLINGSLGIRITRDTSVISK
ncbi:hypothetical protein A3194_12415 [Candidatus Thiodiazotropha endoloripes]|uniref:FliM/FliN family flagellar motor C-terminal domain-containing protein n=1 Tax=Candidatus Thiodiazotropha endoloripes TaxID=1818881 RepID=UPI00083E4CD8|nr:FliM/FliN family flagellar motor C-terminal domain-containing protein [Candidatus Thiodiazotropha endoloripes]ODB85631.1 hypothetical protein A3194_12415 [Candidatus Thiodiazotropha endoloripes]